MTFLIELLIPVLMLGIGILVKYRPPKNINDWVGYRTELSRKNQETWDYAHEQMAYYWIRIGLAEIILSAVIAGAALLLDEKLQNIIELILVCVQTAFLVISMVPIEAALRKKFDKNGNPVS